MDQDFVVPGQKDVSSISDSQTELSKECSAKTLINLPQFMRSISSASKFGSSISYRVPMSLQLKISTSQSRR